MRLKETIEAYRRNDPAARSGWEVFWLYNGLHATMYYRVAHWLYEHRLRFLGRWVSQFARRRTGIEIHPAAKIGRRLVIDHGTGIVIGATTEIGDDCLLYQNVTLGGTGMTNGKRHPTLGNNVMVGSGAIWDDEDVEDARLRRTPSYCTRCRRIPPSSACPAALSGATAKNSIISTRQTLSGWSWTPCMRVSKN